VQKVVQRQDPGGCDGPRELLGQRSVDRAEQFARHLSLPAAERPAAQIDRGCHQCLVQRQRDPAMTAHTRVVGKRLRQRLPQTDAHVLDRVMGIDVQIACRPQRHCHKVERLSCEPRKKRLCSSRG
jgi:hypothetical protein